MSKIDDTFLWCTYWNGQQSVNCVTSHVSVRWILQTIVTIKYKGAYIMKVKSVNITDF